MGELRYNPVTKKWALISPERGTHRNSYVTNDVIDELCDRFGEPPKSVINLIDIALVRSIASSFGIYEIKQQNNSFLLFSNRLKQALLEKFIKSFGKNVSIKATAKPHICIKIDPLKSIVNNLKDILFLS